MIERIFTREELEEKTAKELKRLCIDEYKLPGLSKKGKGIVINAILDFYRTLDTSELSHDDENITTTEQIDTKVTPINAMKFQMNSIITKPNAEFGDRNTTTIHVSCGASSGEFHVVGRTIFEISEFLREVLNVSTMAISLVNGKIVDNEYIVKEGDEVEFLKPAGQKG
jgi:molybdopterin converting factor small subunit